MSSGLPVTLEDALTVEKAKPLAKPYQVINELETYVKELSIYSDEYLHMRRKLKEELELPAEPCYITPKLYNKEGKLVHIVGQGEFSGLDEEGKPMLLYDRQGLPKNADGSVRRFTLGEIAEIQRKRAAEVVNLPKRPQMARRKMQKKKKNAPPRKVLNDFDEIVAAETERLRKMQEMV